MKFFKNLAAYINKYTYKKNSLLYIEITNHTLTLALLLRKKQVLDVINKTTIKLENSEYVHETIFNPTAIHAYIKNYVHEHSLSKPKTLVCLPEYKNIPPEKQLMAILQAALCVAKQPTYIEAIIKEPLLTDARAIPITHYLDAKKTDLLIPFKYYNQHSPITWLARTGIIVGIFIAILGYIQISEQSQYTRMQQEFDILEAQTEKLKEKVQALHDIQDEISYFQGKIELVTDLSRTKHNPVKLLLALSRSMPKNTFITHVTIGHKTPKSTVIPDNTKKPEILKMHPDVKAQEQTQENKHTDRLITIEGLSNETDQITLLLSNLAKQSTIEDLSLVKIKKIKKKHLFPANTSESKYYFRIAGFLE